MGLSIDENSQMILIDTTEISIWDILYTIDGLSLGWPPWPVGFTKLGP